MPPSSPPLPIDAVVPDIVGTLRARSAAVLVAPPGAGKTTRVPLALLDADWLAGRKVMVLEPRRLAARGAAQRMAATLGERLGETVGLRARLATQVGPRTRIEVITEGVFTRMIIDDPALAGIGAILFDEFHERSLDADLGLALALDAQAGLREDLRILVMSATIDGARVAALAGDAPVISCEGRMFPVETRYLGRSPQARIEEQMTAAIIKAVDEESGSVLAFLPGQAEIRRTAERLAERVRDPGVDIVPLYGGLELAEQARAIEPAPPGRRKVVLATAIAETSLTIEGVRVVVDCGLARVPRYEPGSGMTRLETVKVSRASAEQRRGRAGRLEPGVCYRLWAEPETQSLPAFGDPEIRNADLTRLLLDCQSWGVADPLTLRWLDPPAKAALGAARQELTSLGALDAQGGLTELGRHLSSLPLPPRLAAMLVSAAAHGQAGRAAEIAAVLVERGLGGVDSDLAHRLRLSRSDRSRRAEDMRRLARGWAETAQREAGQKAPGAQSLSDAQILALAFPDRIAKARGAGGQYLLANGRGAVLDEGDPLSRAPFLVVAELTGSAAAGRIRLAASLEEVEVTAVAGDAIKETVETTFDPASASVRCRRTRRLGAIVLASEPRPVVPGETTARALIEGIIGLGIARLPWSKAQLQLRERVEFMRQAAGEPWPDLTDTGLAQSAEAWLLPFLDGKKSVSEIRADDLAHGLDVMLPWNLKQQLESEAPSHFTAPTGNNVPIDYSGLQAPSISIRVQELFGLKAHPAIAGQRRPLTLELLSPAHRPIQITRDLPGFWAGSWAGVRADLRGRYPKHDWPEDPANAVPTARAKPRPR